jgi:hypothetical protein
VKRHKYEVHVGATGMVCTAMVADAEGCGDQCGLPVDDLIHGDRYDEFTMFYLRQQPLSGEEQDDIPVVGNLCIDCGVVVVDTAVHDRHHEELSALSERLAP